MAEVGLLHAGRNNQEVVGHLQERDLIKMSSLTAAVADALCARGADRRQASLTAQAAVAVFATAYDRWIDADGAGDLPALMQQSLDDLRKALNAA